MKTGFNCVKCKGKLECGLPRCPIIERLKVKNDFKPQREFKSNTGGVFIGWHGYPQVNAGVLTPYKEMITQNPSDWVTNSTITDVISYRSSLLNSRRNVKVSDLKGFTELVQSSALTSKPLSVDVELKSKPVMNVSYNLHAQPMGPSVDIQSLTLNEDPRMKKVVKKVYYDEDLNATNALLRLKKEGLKEYEISSLLSSGSLGVQKNRKLVPTRWAITATDDSLGKESLKQVRVNEVLDYYLVFKGNFFGNHFTILLMPQMWSYELIEAWMPGSVYNEGSTQLMTDHEGFNGRKKYASNTAGGYYASRLPITDWLVKKRLQASALAVRVITEDYYAPLGVWVVREAARKAMNSTPKRFHNLNDARLYIERLTGVDLRHSKLMKEKQTRLDLWQEPTNNT